MNEEMKQTKVKAIRYHDISCGHRVVGHESKCRHLHGHNYRVHFHCEADSLDQLGRVIDFSVIKDRLCEWLEVEWDHKFLAWDNDPVVSAMYLVSNEPGYLKDMRDVEDLVDSIVFLPFNPTAENLALYLMNDIAPKQLHGTGVVVTKVIIEETRKCFVEVGN